MKTTACAECGIPFSYEPAYLEGREIFPQSVCEGCVAARAEDKRKSDERAQATKTLNNWNALCPPEYQDTDMSRLPRSYQIAVQRWIYGCKGIGFCGEAGKGKTRSAFQMLKKSHFNGIRCHHISAERLGECGLEKTDFDTAIKTAARREILLARSAALLLLDDIGKGRMSESSEKELYSLLEHRTSNRLTTIWTSEAGSNALFSRFSQERRDAILRRLIQFSEIL